jgi:hypothetical protein
MGHKNLYFHAAIKVYGTVKNIFWRYNPKVGVCGGAFGSGTALQVGRLQVQFPMV